ncbi:hypothetical protein ACFY4I_07410 [Streptomyces scabiei]|uniref:hypothetical protein n=1 Tax=Streptomyces scabiei TaxID=1930 RepID=UPI0036C5AE03
MVDRLPPDCGPAFVGTREELAAHDAATTWAPCSRCAWSLSSAEPRPWPPSSAVDIDSGLREQIGLVSSTPNASTPGGLLARRNGDALDDAVGAWLARYATDPVDEHDDPLVDLAVDGKTVRGSRTDGAAVHLLADALHACQTLIAQRRIAGPHRRTELPAVACPVGPVGDGAADPAPAREERFLWEAFPCRPPRGRDGRVADSARCGHDGSSPAQVRTAASPHAVLPSPPSP